MYILILFEFVEFFNIGRFDIFDCGYFIVNILFFDKIRVLKIVNDDDKMVN